MTTKKNDAPHDPKERSLMIGTEEHLRVCLAQTRRLLRGDKLPGMTIAELAWEIAGPGALDAATLAKLGEGLRWLCEAATSASLMRKRS